MKIIIAEKEIAGRNIARILSNGKAIEKREGKDVYWKFDDYVLIPLKGHIVDIDFEEKYRNWKNASLEEMIESKVKYKIKVPGRVKLLKKFGKIAEEVIVATDYDREGELIGLEGVNIIREVNPNVKVKRAIFSAITEEEIKKAFSDLKELNYNLAFAALTRRELDLFYGAILTRFISLATKRLGKSFLSVGRVQTPTLSLIVELEEKIKNFKPEKYFTIEVVANYNGKRFKLISKDKFKTKEEAEKLRSKEGIVAKYVERKVKVKRVKPFNTTEFLREASSKLNLQPARALGIAESLYMKGIISYPRTDNQSYDKVNLKKVLNELKKVSNLKKYVDEILSKPLSPEEGKKSKDHPPIHPVKGIKKGEVSDVEWKVYMLICKRFLATLSEVGEDLNKKVEVKIKNKIFVGDGKEIIKLGWRKIYDYVKVEEKELPSMKKGDKVIIEKFEIKEQYTKPPKRYGYASIIKKMEELNLGTKATRAEILQKLVNRKYIFGRNSLIPTSIAFSLINSLRKNAPIITKPELTALLEIDMSEIENGNKNYEDVISEGKRMLKKILAKLKEEKEKIAEDMKKAIYEDRILGKCKCGGNLIIIKYKGKRFVGCSNYPNCKVTYPLPQKGRISKTNEVCNFCGTPIIKVKFKGKREFKMCLDPNCESKKNFKKS